MGGLKLLQRLFMRHVTIEDRIENGYWVTTFKIDDMPALSHKVSLLKLKKALLRIELDV